MGSGNLSYAAKVPSVQIVAVCDCLPPAIDGFIANVGEGQNWKRYVDFREMCEKEKLDGVTVVTPANVGEFMKYLNDLGVKSS